MSNSNNGESMPSSLVSSKCGFGRNLDLVITIFSGARLSTIQVNTRMCPGNTVAQNQYFYRYLLFPNGISTWLYSLINVLYSGASSSCHGPLVFVPFECRQSPLTLYQGCMPAGGVVDRDVPISCVCSIDALEAHIPVARKMSGPEKL